MRVQSTLSLLFFCCVSSIGQVDNVRMKNQAEETAKALLNDDYETLIKFTYPKVIKLIGGKEKMISIIKKGKFEMNDQGISFEKVDIGEPGKAVKAGDEIHALIPQTVFMKVPNGRMKSETNLLAISTDNGNNWYFLDTVNLTMETIKNILPNYNTDLILPIKSKPVFLSK